MKIVLFGFDFIIRKHKERKEYFAREEARKVLRGLRNFR